MARWGAGPIVSGCRSSRNDPSSGTADLSMMRRSVVGPRGGNRMDWAGMVSGPGQKNLVPVLDGIDGPLRLVYLLSLALRASLFSLSCWEVWTSDDR